MTTVNPTTAVAADEWGDRLRRQQAAKASLLEMVYQGAEVSEDERLAADVSLDEVYAAASRGVADRAEVTRKAEQAEQANAAVDMYTTGRRHDIDRLVADAANAIEALDHLTETIQTAEHNRRQAVATLSAIKSDRVQVNQVGVRADGERFESKTPAAVGSVTKAMARLFRIANERGLGETLSAYANSQPPLSTNRK